MRVQYSLYTNKINNTHNREIYHNIHEVFEVVKNHVFNNDEKNLFITIEVIENEEVKFESDIYVKRNSKYYSIPTEQLTGWI